MFCKLQTYYYLNNCPLTYSIIHQLFCTYLYLFGKALATSSQGSNPLILIKVRPHYFWANTQMEVHNFIPPLDLCQSPFLYSMISDNIKTSKLIMLICFSDRNFFENGQSSSVLLILASSNFIKTQILFLPK